MFRLAYVSQAVSADPEIEDLASILEASDRNNRRAGVTGGLLVSNGRFFQVLEGRESSVRGAYDRIARDDRHTHVRQVWSGEVPGRLFEGWAMAAARVSVGQSAEIARAIDLAADYPHGAISSLLKLVTGSRQ